MLKLRFTLLILAGFLPALTQGAGWPVDEIGFPYRLVDDQGMLRRDYVHPARQAVAWESREHLTQLGFVDTRIMPERVGFDAFGRTWLRDELGYAYWPEWSCGHEVRHYYEPIRRAYAAQTREIFQHIDVRAAVRRATRNLVVRGLNGTEIRAGIRDSVRHGLNTSGYVNSPPTTFRNLLVGGIEDAAVEAFNRIRTESDTVSAPAVREEPSADPAPLDPRKYATVQLVTSGWVVSPAGIQPLVGKEYSVASLRDQPDLVDVYDGTRLVASECRFRGSFEEARACSEANVRAPCEPAPDLE